jgi:predicted permease
MWRRVIVSKLESTAQDLRYAARSWRRTPGLAVTALVTLTVGIGANTAVFSLVNAVLLRPLPFPDSSRIVWFLTSTPDGIYANASDARFNAWRSLSSTFESVSAFAFPSMLLRTDDHFEDVIVGHVSEDFFALFGARAEVGRLFTAAETSPGGDRVANISDAMWRRRFDGKDAIGRTIELNRQSYVIVGVLQPGFDSKTFTSARYADADVWLPNVIDPASADLVNRFGAIAGRLRPSVSLTEAQARVAVAGEALRHRHPGYFSPTDRFTVQPLQPVLARHDRQPLLVLAGAVGLVLLIACANIANLLLSRGADRASEIAVRAALGASPGRIARQLVTEGVLLAAVGAVAGLVLGRIAIDLVVRWTGPTITRIGLTGHGVPIDFRLFVFVGVTTVLAVLCFATAPALISSRVDLSARFAGRSGPRGPSWLGHLLTTIEMAMALVLLVAALLLMRSFANLGAVQPGFDPQNLLAVQVTRNTSNTTAAEQGRFIKNESDLVRMIPGVIDVAASIAVPFDQDTDSSLRYVIEGRPLDGPYHGIGAWRPVESRYFETLRIPLLRGRTFTESDSLNAPPVVIINKAMADKWWPQADPIGQGVILGSGTGWDEAPRQIVGIVANVREESPDQNPIPTNYIPIAQFQSRGGGNGVFSQVTWIVRTAVDSGTLAPRIVEALQQSNGGMPTVSLGEISAIMDRSRSRASFRMWLMTAFGGTAVFLAAIGVYGVASYRVRQRTREIGIRLALGADRRDLVRSVLVDSLRFSLAGVAIGAGLAFVAARVLAALMFGITPHDPTSFAFASVCLVLIAIIAAWFPARRAAGVNPIAALRFD